MQPFIVLVGVFAITLLAGSLGFQRFSDWLLCLRWALAAMFLVTAVAHFGPQRDDLIRMVPPGLPRPALLVTLTGLAEIAGAVGLLIPRLAPVASAGLALLLLAVFPANVHAAREQLAIGDRTVTPLVPRIMLQMVFVAAVLVAGFGDRWFRRPARAT